MYKIIDDEEEIIEDGFDVISDAEKFISDNGIDPFTCSIKEMNRYDVMEYRRKTDKEYEADCLRESHEEDDAWERCKERGEK